MSKQKPMELFTESNPPTIYYGDEIGMRDVPIPQDEIVDPQGLNMPDRDMSRDPARTPMQWNADEFAGFSGSKPWLRLPHSFRRVNVELQKQDPDSMLSFYHSLIILRKRQPAFQTGKYTPVYSDKQLLAFIRENDTDRFLVVLNLSHRPGYLRPKNETLEGEIIISTETERIGLRIENNLLLSGDEGLIVRLER